MPHLTSLALDVRHPQVASDLADCHQLHRTVMRLIDSEGPFETVDGSPTLRMTTNTLFRVNTGAGQAELLLQSSRPVDHSRLPDGSVLRRRDLDLRRVLGRIDVDTRIRYTLIAAPVKNTTRTDDHGNAIRGTKTPLMRIDEVTRWWDRRLPQIGLSADSHDGIPLLRIDPAPSAIGKKKQADGQHLIQHRAFRIGGIATVTDRALLSKAIHDGIGPGKAYGMGLLTVVPS